MTNVPAGQRTIRVRRLGFNPADKTVTVTAGATVDADFARHAVRDAARESRRHRYGRSGRAKDDRQLGHAARRRRHDAEAGGVERHRGAAVEDAGGDDSAWLRRTGHGGRDSHTRNELDQRATSRWCSSTACATASTTSGASRPPVVERSGLAQSTQVTSALNFLNPNDIESIEVIKGPAAATLYGAEAANGVIQIITKKGTRGQQKMQFGVRARAWHERHDARSADEPTRRATRSRRTRETRLAPAVWPGCQSTALECDHHRQSDCRAIRSRSA